MCVLETVLLEEGRSSVSTELGGNRLALVDAISPVISDRKHCVTLVRVRLFTASYL